MRKFAFHMKQSHAFSCFISGINTQKTSQTTQLQDKSYDRSLVLQNTTADETQCSAPAVLHLREYARAKGGMFLFADKTIL